MPGGRSGHRAFRNKLPVRGVREERITMAKRILDKWQGYTVEDCASKYCLYYGGSYRGKVKCRAESCVCKEERDDALRRAQLASTIKYVIIQFTENMKPGSARPRKDKIVIEMEPTFEKLGFYNLKSQNPDSAFHCWNHERFRELLQILRDWDRAGIEASSVERFERPVGWDTWRQDVFFEDKDVHWQILIEYANGTCAAYVHRNILFPKELRRIYALAESMNPKK